MSSHLISRNGEHVIESIPLTSWEKTGYLGESDEKQQIGWRNNKYLFVSNTIQNFYKPDWADPCDTNCGYDECCGKALKEAKRNRSSRTEVPVNAFPKHKFFCESSQNKTVFSGAKGTIDAYPAATSEPTHLKDEWLGE
eukprot:386064_1